MEPDLESILASIAEFDTIGREAFLEKYASGIGSKSWFIIYDGSVYDMKAVWAASHRPVARPSSFNTSDPISALQKEEYSRLGIQISDDLLEAKSFEEGQRRRRLAWKIERDPRVKLVAREHYGYQCMICNFDYTEKYGELGAGFIECHHLKPLSQTGPTLTSLDDVIVVCANCHRMIHQAEPPLAPDIMRSILADQRR